MNSVSRSEFQETSNFEYSTLERISRKLFSSREKYHNHSHVQRVATNDGALYKYDLNEVELKFWGDKKGPT